MTPDDLTTALAAAFQNGFKDFLVGSMVAALPLLWVAALSFYLMRPYAIRTLRKLSMRFGADVFWLSYVLLRDGMLIATFATSLVFFYPNLLHDNPIPVTAPLSAVFALWVLLIKMVRDPDENPRDYRLSAALLVAGSMLYLLPLTLGVEVASQRHMDYLAQHLVSNTNFDVALGVFYISMALLLLTGAFIFGYVVKTSAPKAEPSLSRPTAAAPDGGLPVASGR